MLSMLSVKKKGYFTTLFYDITEHKSKELEIKKQKEKLDLIIEGTEWYLGL